MFVKDFLFWRVFFLFFVFVLSLQIKVLIFWFWYLFRFIELHVSIKVTLTHLPYSVCKSQLQNLENTELERNHDATGLDNSN
jgi:hypothetical protein